jgi:glycine/D-amino acid oxidase-like deaminating enzyme
VNARADVVVVGGGIVGAACAYYLCRAGLEVHLMEWRFPASGTSRACDGLILLWDKSPGAELALGQASAELWTELAATLPLDFEYTRAGTIFLAETEAGLDAGRATAQALGAKAVRAQLLDNRDLRALEPNLAPDLAGGVLFPDDAQVDARLATLALLSAAQEVGLIVHAHSPVVSIQRDGGGTGAITAVVTPDDSINTGTLVCAAGVWSTEVAHLAGVNLPLRPRKGHILVTARRPGLVRHPMLEGGYVSTVQSASEDLQVAFVAEPTAAGTLLLGSSRESAGMDRSVALHVVQAIARRAVRFLPSAANLPVIRSYAGLRPWSPDHLPLIGPWPAVPGLYIAAGHEGAGISLAPITGRLIADWITGTALPAYADGVRADRYAGPTTS